MVDAIEKQVLHNEIFLRKYHLNFFELEIPLEFY
jgi:hypothetical protein